MRKNIVKISFIYFAFALALSPLFSVFARADSNVITNITGSAEYLAAASGPTTMVTDGRTFAIEANVYVCTNPDGKWIEDSTSFSQQGDKIGTVVYWDNSKFNDREIRSTNINMDARRDGGERISTSALKDKYSWNEAIDRRLPDTLPSPLTAGADSFRSWSNDPENMVTTIDHAVAAAFGSTGSPTEAQWQILYDRYKGGYTEISGISPKDFTPLVNESTGMVDCKVEWFVAYSVKVLYRENNSGTEELLFVDCNHMGQLNQHYKSGMDTEEINKNIENEKNLQFAALMVVNNCNAFLRSNTPVEEGQPFVLDG